MTDPILDKIRTRIAEARYSNDYNEDWKEDRNMAYDFVLRIINEVEKEFDERPHLR